MKSNMTIGKSNLFNRIILGLKQKPLKVCLSIFVAYAAIWTILEPLLGIVPAAVQYLSGELKFVVLLIISILIGLYRSAVPVDLSILYGNSVIKILFGDLFAFDGITAIPVSRHFFETEVVTTSLQHKVIQSFVQSQEGTKGFDVYEKRLSIALENESYKEIYRGNTQIPEKYYSLGASAFLDIRGQDYLLFALTESEVKGYIPKDNCNVSKMWTALEVFWRSARIHSRGNSVNIPLIGSGVTGIRLNPRQILELNLLAISNAIEEAGKITTEEIRIILHPKYIDILNLNDFQSLWK